MKMDGRGIAGEILELFARLTVTFADRTEERTIFPTLKGPSFTQT